MKEKSINLLLVEDNKLDQKVMAKELAKRPNFQFTFVGSLKEAKEKLKENQFDLVILDASLPDGTSSQLFPLLREIPFIIVAGAGSEEFAIEAYKAGASDYIIKDVNCFYLKLFPWTLDKALKNKELDSLKESFLSTASHEIRAPLTVIAGHISNLKNGVYDPLTEAQMAAVNSLNRNAHLLTHIVDDLLDLSRLESGKTEMNQSRISLKKIVGDVLADYKKANEKIVTLKNEIPKDLPEVWADKEMITRLLTNLVNNAIRFAKSQVTLQASLADRKVQVNVMDDGPGIPADQQKELFEKFKQLQRSKSGSGYKGTGLGLAICKEIVELHGGKIRVESATDQGAKFCFSLPRDLRRAI